MQRIGLLLLLGFFTLACSPTMPNAIGDHQLEKITPTERKGLEEIERKIIMMPDQISETGKQVRRQEDLLMADNQKLEAYQTKRSQIKGQMGDLQKSLNPAAPDAAQQAELAKTQEAALQAELTKTEEAIVTQSLWVEFRKTNLSETKARQDLQKAELARLIAELRHQQAKLALAHGETLPNEKDGGIKAYEEYLASQKSKEQSARADLDKATQNLLKARVQTQNLPTLPEAP